MGYFWNIHVFLFYLLMQMVTQLFQATGWPSVVAVIRNLFGKRKRGFIMGIWNSHTSVGNISGSLLAAAVMPLLLKAHRVYIFILVTILFEPNRCLFQSSCTV